MAHNRGENCKAAEVLKIGQPLGHWAVGINLLRRGLTTNKLRKECEEKKEYVGDLLCICLELAINRGTGRSILRGLRKSNRCRHSRTFEKLAKDRENIKIYELEIDVIDFILIYISSITNFLFLQYFYTYIIFVQQVPRIDLHNGSRLTSSKTLGHIKYSRSCQFASTSVIISQPCYDT